MMKRITKNPASSERKEKTGRGRFSKLSMWLIVFTMAAFIGSCGVWDRESPLDPTDTVAPTVMSTTPANNATDVFVNSNLTATFSEEMDDATITTATFTLEGPGTTAVAGAVTYVGTAATFNPTADLAGNTLYTATITTGAKDLAGNALAADYVWTFTTGATPDTTPPTVSSTTPANNAIDVFVNSNLTATFSEEMDATTISTATFTLEGPGATAVAGAVTYVGTTATFNPTNDLAANTLFTATITTGAKDLAGNALAADYVWTFTSGATPDTTPPTVSSTTPANNALNVLINSNMTATFSETMDATTISTATFTVTGPTTTPVAGTVTYVGTTATFNPTNDLAGNTLFTATITTGAEDLAGNALEADYVWTFTTGETPDTTPPTVSSTTPANNALNVVINSNVTATFSEEMDASTITTATFTVTGPTTTPVAGTVTYVGTTATFNPTNDLAGNTLFTATITTGAEDLAGNALEADYVWTFTTGETPDTTPPTVSSTTPANNAIGVFVNSNMTATFSEEMDASTITTATFTVTGPTTTPVAGAVTYVGTTATFNPTADLAGNTLFTATITTGAKDLAGNALEADYVWTFTTGETPDTTPPTVISTLPADNAIDVLVNSNMTATFSEEMDASTITTATFKLEGPGTTPVAGAVTYAGTTATFNPTNDLEGSTLFTATITTGAKDLAGNALESDYVWTFTTEDTTPPTVISTIPVDNAIDVFVNIDLTATFSEEMDALTITALTFKLEGPGTTPVAGAVAYVGTSAIFEPTNDLEGSTLYTATITTGVTDLAGNAMESDYVWTFTTEDITPPTVISTVPADNAIDVLVNDNLSVTFSEEMDATTVTTVTFKLEGPETTPVAGTVTYVGTTATFNPTNDLEGSTLFTATITTGVTDLAGNAMESDYVWTFTTEDVTPPFIISTLPVDGAPNISIHSVITAKFSEPMNPSTISNLTFVLEGPGTTPVDGTVSYLDSVATFTPSNPLEGSTLFTATVTMGVEDLAGNAMERDSVWTFTTGFSLGAAEPFGGFGGDAGMTNEGIYTVVYGDIGTTAASSLITGFHDSGGNVYTETPLNVGYVTGLIYTATDPPGSDPGVIAAACALDARDAFINLSPAALPGGIDVSIYGGGAGELGSRVLAPGIYKSAPGSYDISLGDLTLDAQGDPNALWVFQMESTLTVGIEGAGGARSVILINGAKTENVFWQVGSSATINGAGGGTMEGTIIAEAGVTFSTSGNVELTTLNGRALGLNASVTLVNTIINVPEP